MIEFSKEQLRKINGGQLLNPFVEIGEAIGEAIFQEQEYNRVDYGADTAPGSNKMGDGQRTYV
jgi:hypothetical protein